MRLTRKLEPPYERVFGEDYVYTSDTRLTPSFASVEQKLGKLEDFEDKFGCPLEKALKALEDGYFARKWDGSIVAIKTSPGVYYSHSLSECEDGWFISSENAFESEPISLPLKDYGKTWALTKEELQ